MTEPAMQARTSSAIATESACNRRQSRPSLAQSPALIGNRNLRCGPMLAHHRPFGPELATILLVEDSRQAAEAVRMMTRRLGLRLRRAEDLDTARRHLKVYRPDLALVDLGLPDGSGLELIAELVGGATGRCRIVAVSADPAARAEALAAGAHAFLEKPLRLPADLASLFGAPLSDKPKGSGPADDNAQMQANGRNAGEDPLALRDDLQRARRLLVSDDPADRDYAVSFLKGLGRSTGDVALADAAAANGGGSGSGTRMAGLVAAVDARVTATPL